ncbi:MAG: histidine kinase [Marinoscillum sp.]
MFRYTVSIIFLIIGIKAICQDVESLIGKLSSAELHEQPAILNELSKKVRGSNTDSAMTFAKRAYALASQIDDKEQMALANKNIGIIHWFNYELDSALVSYGKSLNSFVELGREDEVANLYNNISIVFSKQEQKDTAIALYQKALEINLKRNDSVGIARNYLNLAVLYGEVENYQTEMHYQREALKYSYSSADFIYSNMAGTMSNLYGPDSAIFYYRKALELCKIDFLIARIYLNLGPHFRVLGMIDSARIYLEKGKLLLSDKLSEEYAKALMDEGSLFELEGNYSRSLGLYLKANHIAESQKYNALLIDLWQSIAHNYGAIGNWNNAYQWSRKHQQLQDSMTNVENSRHLAELQAKFEYEQHQRKIGELTRENLLKEVQIAADRNFKLVLLIGFGFIIMLSIILFVIYKRRQERREQGLAMKSLEIEQRMLRSQMNPHFIFNALNSIQSFITTNKAYEAEVFMSKFSLLVRKILENSTQKLIALDEEVETLDLYLTLEKSRFEERFDFEIIEDADGMISIPPMLLQPFVENAIIHGMKGKSEKGKITVRFLEQEDHLICEVEDDGVGRSAEEQKKAHRSLATSLTNDRINYFNEASSAGAFALQILDLKDSGSEPIGTKVTLTIPLDV